MSIAFRQDLFETSRQMFGVSVDETVEQAARGGARVIFNLSGGKDSGALSYAAAAWLDQIGHPADRRHAIHADLGRAEWRSTPATVEATAARLGVPLIIVRRSAGDLVARWEKRFSNALERYERLETYNLIGPWSQANKRFCTSELKAQVIGPHLARMFRGQTVVQVVGIRRDESRDRASTEISNLDTRFAKPGNRHGTRMMLWHPGVLWSRDEVMDCHARHGIPLHEAYTAYGSTRLSCAFCILASLKDLEAAASAAGNRDLYLHLVGMEASSTFSFQPERWLADVAPGLLPPSLLAATQQAKLDAAARRSIEEAMPTGLRYVKSWPPRVPTIEEGEAIVRAREPILARHNLRNLYDTPHKVRDRFAELIAARDAKAARAAA